MVNEASSGVDALHAIGNAVDAEVTKIFIDAAVNSLYTLNHE